MYLQYATASVHHGQFIGRHPILFEHGFTIPEEVSATLETAVSRQHTIKEKLRKNWNPKKELMRQIAVYRKTKRP